MSRCRGSYVTVHRIFFYNQKPSVISQKVTLSVYSQEHSFNIHPALLDEPSSKSVTGCIGEVDHGLGEGVGEAISMGLLLGVPVPRVRQIRETNHCNQSELK